MALVGRKEHSYENEDSLGNLYPKVKSQIDLGNSQRKEGKNLPYITWFLFFFMKLLSLSIWINASSFKITNILRKEAYWLEAITWIYIVWIPLTIDGFAPKFEFKERREGSRWFWNQEYFGVEWITSELPQKGGMDYDRQCKDTGGQEMEKKGWLRQKFTLFP